MGPGVEAGAAALGLAEELGLEGVGKGTECEPVELAAVAAEGGASALMGEDQQS